MLKYLKMNNSPMAKGQKVTSEVFPVRATFDDYLQRKDGAFVAILRVIPVNVALLNTDATRRAMQSIERAINGVGGRIQIMISNQVIRMDAYIQYLKDVEATTTDDDHLEELEALRTRVTRGNGMDTKIPSFYISIEEWGKQETASRRLQERLKQVMQRLRVGGFGSEVVDEQEFLQHVYERLNPTSCVIAETKEQRSLVGSLPSYVIDRDTYFVIDDRYFKVLTIASYPVVVDHAGWLADIYSGVDVDMSVTLIPSDKSMYLKSLSKSMQAIRNRLNSKVPDFERVKLKRELEDAEYMLEDMSGNNVQMYQAVVLLMVSAESPEELREKTQDLLVRLRGLHMTGSVVSWYGLDPLWYMLPILHQGEVEKYERWNMGSNLVASMVPFNLPSYSEVTGLPMATNRGTQEYIVVDRFNRRLHPNGNMYIQGTSGAGKSYFMTGDILREAARSTQCIVIDPEREYVRLSNARRIVFSLGSHDTINLFHIRSAIVDTDEGQKDIENLGMYLRKKIADNMTFFRSIYPGMSHKQSAILLQAQKLCYESKGMTFETKELNKEAEFPTFSTLEEVLKEIGSPAAQDLIDVFEPFAKGAYASMFNGQTNVEFNEHITVLDVHDLSDEIKTPMMDLLIRDVWELIKLNRSRGRKIGFWVDEVGLLGADNAVQTLRFLMTLGKRIRKYGGNLTTATQNAEDLFSESVRRYGAAIVKNARFRLLLQMTRDDVSQLRQVVDLSDKEEDILIIQEKIEEGEQGKGILSIGNFKIEVQTFATPVELRAADPTAYATLYGSAVTVV